jgi:putative phage-type endonuclease
MLTKEQLELRRTGIGGSDVAIILGLTLKWKTPIDLYLEKTGIEEIISNDDNQYTYWGKTLEPVVADEYAKRTGKTLSICDTKRHSEHSFMLANIDRMIDDGGILECKTADFTQAKHWGESGTNCFPKIYLLQCAHYAIVYDAPYVDLAVLIGGNDFRTYTYKRNLPFEKELIRIEKEFWEEHVEKFIPPLITSSQDASKIWNDVSNDDDNFVIASDDNLRVIIDINHKKKQIDELKAETEKLKLTIISLLEDKAWLIDNGGKKLCSYKSMSTSRVNINTLKEKYPDIHQECIMKQDTRVFRNYL